MEGVLEHDEEFPLAGFTLRINIGDNLVELVPSLNQIVFYTSVVHIFLLTERQRSPSRHLWRVGVQRLVGFYYSSAVLGFAFPYRFRAVRDLRLSVVEGP